MRFLHSAEHGSGKLTSFGAAMIIYEFVDGGFVKLGVWRVVGC
jgi:hypothetical protein